MVKTDVAVQHFPCKTCGASVAETAMVVGGAPRENAVAAGVVFCSVRCLSAANAREAYAKRCLRCGGVIDPAAGPAAGGPGRPLSYCTAACRRAAERGYAAALRRLAAGMLPARQGDSAEAWAGQAEESMAWAREAERLLARVQRRRRDGAPGFGEDDARLPTTVDAHLISAIKAWLALLWDLHQEARRGEGKAYLRAEDAAGMSTTLSLAERARRARSDDAAWRQDLLSKAGVEEPAVGVM